jgi:tetratricopeptide (TPR) repeat protein
MADDDDIARLLPEPPPPRPAGRDAAIASAMRRFDGIADPAREAAKPARAHGPGWLGIGRGQIGVLASLLLVAMISIPVALHSPSGPIGPIAPSPPSAERSQATAPRADGSAPGASVAKPATTDNRAAVSDMTERRQPALAAAENRIEAAKASRFEAELPPPPPIPAPAPAYIPPQEPTPPAGASIVVTGARAPASPARERALAVTTVTEEKFEDSSEVVVTAARRSRRASAASRRGDWNACTVSDPEESLRGCKHLIDPGAKGPAGVAAARLSDGLALAWRGDLDEAITKLDQAIALQPRLAIAYLNRGLAHQRKGELAQAAADLDRAVRYAPYAPRGYYNRSALRRERGDLRRARADATRAAELDPQYEALVE